MVRGNTSRVRRAHRRVRRRGALGPLAVAPLLAALAVAGCDSNPAPAPTTSTPSTTVSSSSTTSPTGATPGRPATFLKTQGTQFMLDGQEFRFSGFNLFDAAASAFYACEPHNTMSDEQLRAAFREIKGKSGAKVVRFWAYQPFTKGGTDFAGVDRVINAAKSEGMLVMPVLEDGPGYCTTGAKAQPKMNWQDDTYYTEGYRKPFGSASRSLLDYARVMAEHYKNEPTIAAWMIMNEAETKRRSPDGKSVLVEMARTVAREIRKADPNHLVSLGTQGNGAPGNSGADFRDIYSLPEMDYVEVHDWAYYGSDTEAMPGALPNGELPAADSPQCQDKAAKIACSFAIAKALNKPLVVGEIGIKAKDKAAIERRAKLMDAKIQAAKKHGAAGYLIWEVNTFANEGYGIVPGSGDPIWDALARF
jgi:mannan endo-1,4-beta-mannosidase